MSHSRTTSRHIIQFKKKLAHFLGKLADYIEDPSVDNIHDVRTSFRRLEACYSIFPSSVKTNVSESFFAAGKYFFRLNSVVRDSDIMLEKLAKLKTEPSRLVECLHQSRAENLQKAMSVAQELIQLAEPRLKNKKPQFDKHLRHMVVQRISNIQHFIPLIKDDEENVEELHSMRKQAKKLFYLLEIDNDPADCPEMRKLKELQTVAGDIHDCDVTLAFLNDNSSLRDNADTLIHSEQLDRHNHYVKLLSKLENDLWEPLRRLT